MINRKQTLPEGTPGVLGGMFAVWNDQCGNGISQQDVHIRAFPAVQVLTERLWKGDNKQVPYKALRLFAKRCPKRRALTCRVKFLPIKMSP